MRALFTLTVFLSSFLLFLVQPLVGKMVLPTFGGAPPVWTASLVFFQTTLLLGYAYAHVSAARLSLGRQVALHVSLLLVALGALPFGADNAGFTRIQALAAAEAAPSALLVMAALAALVGLPFFAISGSTPLLQRWYITGQDPATARPYVLYSVSNLASLCALLAYPFLLEPRLRLADQSRSWACGYAALCALMIGCGVFVFRSHRRSRRQSPQEASADGAAAPVAIDPPDGRRVLRWIALAAVPSSLLLGVTGYLTSNVAPIPLLWVVPLALYLLSFVLAFSPRRLVPTPLLSRLLPLLLVPVALLLVLEQPQPEFAALHLALFFLAAWMCHAYLYDQRPEPARLTAFYLWVTTGGVIGGVVAGLIAPAVFNTLLEYPLALAAAGALMVPRHPETRAGRSDLLYGVAIAVVTFALIALARDVLGVDAGPVRTAATVGIPVLLCFLASDRPARFALSLGALFLVSAWTEPQLAGKLALTERSFFAVHRVMLTDHGRFRRLLHGTTVHGMQDAHNPDRPLTYYHPTGPLGQVFAALAARGSAPRVAAVGLGVGSLAAYGQPGQRVTFFEIDPAVRRIANDPRLFTFLSNSRGEVDIVLGDARLTLARQPDGAFGLIVLDAFSSDSIPLHLLTREAMAGYVAKLAPGGILAYHISNRYLTLEPVVAAAAADLGLEAWIQENDPTAEERAQGKATSTWMIVARDSRDVATLIAPPARWRSSRPLAGSRAWTDDFSNVIGAFRFER
jgi:hypothetical protein